MTTEQAEKRKRPRQRSPNYPGIGLEDAIECAEALYREDKMVAVPVDVANDHWGYKAGSSVGGVVVSALKKFGLLYDEGSGPNRAVRITERARRIILRSENRAELIREAALSPSIHKELRERYPDGLPSRETLKSHLVVERRFNERSVDDFINQFMETLRFAGLGDPDTLSEDRADKEERQEQPAMTAVEAPPAPSLVERALATVPVDPDLRVFALPISRRQEATLHVPSNLDESGWDQMLAVLNAMKPGILSDDDEPDDDDGELADAP